ncbi:Hsp33 family molecular chaperone HslO [Roseomonas sp. NAR14]|uniref:Hsp33 family molecular chaperone HslO n=1 Tax=Roseomonas acroporae TaxID=2937791 RepID=A0A9X2BUQ3_9PROT|nr:Hsp33 family molecular chaperone HslO [Roseomonas acroporae]MCK8785848.1 Hsp33 family molecular chaperone HslO [Roseomonas acroporae]
MSDAPRPAATPDFLNHDRPPVPQIVVPRGVQPFHLRDRPVRGRLVRLGPLAEALLGRHDNHPAVTRLAGEALALTAGLAAALKFRGSFSLQAKGDGVVPMLLADCTESGELRGYARAEPDKLARLLRGDPDPSAAALLGKGYLAFTCDQGPDMDRYQGIVAIEGISLAQMAGSYFRTSEQIRTLVRLACARTEAGWRAAAFIMEKVATEGGIALGTDDRDADLPAADPEDPDEAWHTACVLADTLTDAELLDDSLPADRLLHRLFHAEGLSVDRARALSYGCRCSRARLAGVLEGFPPEDLDHMVQDDGAITVTCEFCNVGFRFERREVRGKRAAG